MAAGIIMVAVVDNDDIIDARLLENDRVVVPDVARDNVHIEIVSIIIGICVGLVYALTVIVLIQGVHGGGVDHPGILIPADSVAAFFAAVLRPTPFHLSVEAVREVRGLNIASVCPKLYSFR